MPQIAPAAILPYGFIFSVEILGKPLVNFTGIEAGFQEVSGIVASIKIDSITEGGENRFAHKVPARVSYAGNLELKRGLIVASSPFGNWCSDLLSRGLNALGKTIKTHDIIVHLLDNDQVPVMSWQFVGAYPVKWEVTSLNAKQDEIAVESISLAYQYYTTV
jgi:phage tail-like protein